MAKAKTPARKIKAAAKSKPKAKALAKPAAKAAAIAHKPARSLGDVIKGGALRRLQAR